MTATDGTDRLAKLADDNLIAAVRAHAHWQHPSTLVERDGALLLAGSTRYPAGYRNCAVRLDPNLDPTTFLERATAFFAEYGRGFCVVTRTRYDADLLPLLDRRPFRLIDDTPCMLLERPVAAPEPISGVDLRPLVHPAQVTDLLAIVREAYADLGMPETEVDAYFSRPDRLLTEDVATWIAYLDGRPAATALTVYSGNSAGIYWVGTAHHARRRGLAEYCVRQATNAGFARGASVVTLQASEFGADLYLRLGYRTYDTQRFYLRRRPT